MSLRNGLLALVGAIGLSGVVAGEPPINPLVEGREPNPIVREHYLPETPVGGYVAGPEVSKPDPVWWLVMTTLIWDVLLDQLTFPLGTAVVSGEATDA